MAFCTKSAHILPFAVIMLTFSWFCGSQSFFLCVCMLQVPSDSQRDWAVRMYHCISSHLQRSPPWLWRQMGASKVWFTQSAGEVNIISLHNLQRKPEAAGFVWMSPLLSRPCAPWASGNMSEDILSPITLSWPYGTNVALRPPLEGSR